MASLPLHLIQAPPASWKKAEQNELSSLDLEKVCPSIGQGGSGSTPESFFPYIEHLAGVDTLRLGIGKRQKALVQILQEGLIDVPLESLSRSIMEKALVLEETPLPAEVRESIEKAFLMKKDKEKDKKKKKKKDKEKTGGDKDRKGKKEKRKREDDFDGSARKRIKSED